MAKKCQGSVTPRSQELTPKQERFCQEYIDTGGNASEAYRRAYNASRMKAATVHRKAAQLLKEGKIRARIEELRKELEDEKIATLKERLTFWTKVMRDSNEKMHNRLKASELLGKAQGDFVERHEVKAEFQVTAFEVVIDEKCQGQSS